MWDQDHYQYFHNQVTKQDAPNYRDLIKKPICLKDMRNKAKRHEYKSYKEFSEDVELMQLNASLFNGPVHLITKIATTLKEVAERELRDRRDEIANLETLVKESGK